VCCCLLLTGSWRVAVAQPAEDERGAGAAVQVGGRGRGAAEVQVGGAELHGGGGSGAAVGVGAVVVQEAPEQVPVDGHCRLVRDLAGAAAAAAAIVDGHHPHASEHRRATHLPRQVVLERRVCGGRRESRCSAIDLS
jgi:hypothetical protein